MLKAFGLLFLLAVVFALSYYLSGKGIGCSGNCRSCGRHEDKDL